MMNRDERRTDWVDFFNSLRRVRAEMIDKSITDKSRERGIQYMSIWKLTEYAIACLNKHGLDFYWEPRGHAVGCVVFKKDMPEIFIDGSYSLPHIKSDSQHPVQDLGGYITYLRRYVLFTLLGIHPDKDNDGSSTKMTDLTKKYNFSDKPPDELMPPANDTAVEVKDADSSNPSKVAKSSETEPPQTTKTFLKPKTVMGGRTKTEEQTTEILKFRAVEGYLRANRKIAPETKITEEDLLKDWPKAFNKYKDRVNELQAQLEKEKDFLKEWPKVYNKCKDRAKEEL